MDYKAGKYPRRASAWIGNHPASPDVMVAANGGKDLICLPQQNANTLVKKVVKALLAQDYINGVFIRDDFRSVLGTPPLSKVGLKGSARTPAPAIVANFRSETTGCNQPLFRSTTVSDTTLLQGHRHHGSFGRADTDNFMAAIGPAFKRQASTILPR